MMTDLRPIALVGGMGKTGRRVAERLARIGKAVRPLSRSTLPSFDWETPQGWASAIQGARAAYVTYQPDLAHPKASADIAKLANIAIDEGLDHIVMLSGRGEEGAQKAEDVLARSGIRWTVVRASWFAQNFSENFLVEPIRAGELALPVDGVAEPFVDADDIADVVVAILTQQAAAERVYEVTGPAALTFSQATQIIANATNRPIVYRPISPDDFAEDLRKAATPEPVIAMLIELFSTTLDGRNVATADGVYEALGRPAGSFQNYAARASQAGAWPPQRTT